MRPPDNHVHTRWSWDTADSSTMVRACERAVARGLPAIAFTEHLDFTTWDPADRATADGLVDRHASRHLPIDVEGYWAELEECREYRRSEEHTSELQSRQYLVCRLLLEKKNNRRVNLPV